MTSRNFFNLAATKNQIKAAGGSVSKITIDEMPGLVNISFSALKLSEGGALDPIWHPNADKMGYCLKGNALVAIRTPTGVEVFTIEEGEMFFIPKGFVHHITNLDKETEIIFALDHDKPNEMSFFQAVHSISESVFDSTFHTSPEFYQTLVKSKKQNQISVLSTETEGPAFIANRFKFNLKASTKVILTKGGYVQAGTKSNLQVLDGLGVLRFGLNPKGSVEPHWHTNAGELIYIINGQTRITVLAPDGNLDVLEVKGGQGAFAAASHFHNIENIGNEEVEVMAFFSHAEPDFIGVAEVMGSYSNKVLASIFNESPEFFDQFKKPSGPLVIVPV